MQLQELSSLSWPDDFFRPRPACRYRRMEVHQLKQDCLDAASQTGFALHLSTSTCKKEEWALFGQVKATSPDLALDGGLQVPRWPEIGK